MRCVVCDSTEGVRHYEIRVDSVALRVQPDFCQVHGDAYLMQAGTAIGEILRPGGLELSGFERAVGDLVDSKAWHALEEMIASRRRMRAAGSKVPE